MGRGRKPLIIEEPDRRFRLNRPIDDWPTIDTTGLPPLTLPAAPPKSAAPTIAALQAAPAGTDPNAFERAVCADVASETDWTVGHDVWNAGRAIAAFGPEQIHEAQTFGCTTARWLETTGYGTLSVPADAITINVR